MMNRKDEHVHYAEKQYTTQSTAFDDVHFVHHSLPHYALEEINLEVRLMDRCFPHPFFINAMTGGSQWTKTINAQFAEVARETGLMMASGSLSAAIKDPNLVDTFRVIREINPKGFVIANIGANHGLDGALRAIDILNADALEIHLNTPQEIIMPEGDRDFRHYEDHLLKIVENIALPIIVKEVGFGMSQETMTLLRSFGVKILDVSGRGGTNFATIENTRREKRELSYLTDWGQTTPVSLLESQPLQSNTTILASGGIKQPLDIIKALALGASSVGMSGQFLHWILEDGVAHTIQHVLNTIEQLNLIALMLDTPTVRDLRYTDLVITGQTREWCDIRNINTQHYAQRSTLNQY